MTSAEVARPRAPRPAPPLEATRPLRKRGRVRRGFRAADGPRRGLFHEADFVRRLAWPSLPQCPDGTTAPQHDCLIMGTLRTSCKGFLAERTPEATSCEPGRRLWDCYATFTVFYSNFTTPLRRLYDSMRYLWYPPRSLSERPLQGGSSLRQDTPLAQDHDG